MQRALFDLLRRVVPRLPPQVSTPAAILAGGLVYRLAGSMRAAAIQNRSVLLELPAEHRAVRRAALGAFCTLARNYVDMLTLSALCAEQLRERTEVVGLENLYPALAQGRGVIAPLAHLGNIDQAGNALVARGIPCAIVTEVVKPDWLFDFFVAERTHFGGQVVPATSGAFPRLQRLLKAGYAVGIACDWDMPGNGMPVLLPDGRHLLRVPASLPLLALRSKAPIVPVFGERLPSGRSRTHIEPPICLTYSGNLRDDAQRLAELIAERLLARLRAHPEQWVLFHPIWEPAGGPR